MASQSFREYRNTYAHLHIPKLSATTCLNLSEPMQAGNGDLHVTMWENTSSSWILDQRFIRKVWCIILKIVHFATFIMRMAKLIILLYRPWYLEPFLLTQISVLSVIHVAAFDREVCLTERGENRVNGSGFAYWPEVCSVFIAFVIGVGNGCWFRNYATRAHSENSKHWPRVLFLRVSW